MNFTRKYLKITLYINLMICAIKFKRIDEIMKTLRLFYGLIAAIMMISLISCKKEPSLSDNTLGIITRGSTAMRIDPMIFSGIITQLPKGESVEVLEKSREKNYVGKSSDYWYKIKSKSGISGWVFGQNIALHTSSSKDAMNKIVSDFMESESAQIKKYLAGKWWSTNEFGDFTDHCLEIYDNNKYRSYMKEQESQAIVGMYKLDFNKNEIVFSNGTSFKSNLDLVKRGSDYVIKKAKVDFELRFTKIAIELPPEPEIKEKAENKPKAEKNGNPPQ